MTQQRKYTHIRCKFCGKKFEELQRRAYCDDECRKNFKREWQRNYAKKDYVKERAKKVKARWRLMHPEKVKEIQSKTMRKWWIKNADKYNALRKAKREDDRVRNPQMWDRKLRKYIPNPNYDPTYKRE